MQLRRRGKLVWERRPDTVLLVKKWNDRKTTEKMREVVEWLHEQGVRVLVEEAVKREAEVASMPHLEAWNPRHPGAFQPDFAIALGWGSLNRLPPSAAGRGEGAQGTRGRREGSA